MIAAHAITFKTLKNNLAGRSHYVDFNLTVIGLKKGSRTVILDCLVGSRYEAVISYGNHILTIAINKSASLGTSFFFNSKR